MKNYFSKFKEKLLNRNKIRIKPSENDKKSREPRRNLRY